MLTDELLTDDIRDCMRRSVLCWLATVDADGAPNVSPKEIFAAVDAHTVLVAHIASPTTVCNLRSHPQACLSFVDVFVQKGYKLRGMAELVLPTDPRYAALLPPLAQMTGGLFPVRAIIVLRISEVEPILAPSYRLLPGTTEAAQVAAAMRAYGVVPQTGGRFAS